MGASCLHGRDVRGKGRVRSVYSTGGFELTVVSGAVAFDFGTDDSASKAYAQPVDGSWHLSCVCRNGAAQTYLDGQPIDTLGSEPHELTAVCNDSIVVSGFQPENRNNRFTGLLSEIRLWTVARDQEAIARTMHLVLDPAQEPDLVLYYNFRDGTGRELTGRAGTPMQLLGQAKIVPSDVPVGHSDSGPIAPPPTPPTGRIESMSPPSPVAAGFGQLLWLRGTDLPAISGDDVVVTQSGQTFQPFARGTPGLVALRLPTMSPGPATIRLTSPDRSMTTSELPITISEVPATPIITAIIDQFVDGDVGPPLDVVHPGQKIYVVAEGLDTSGALLEWTHPQLPALAGVTHESVTGRGLMFTAIGTVVPAVSPDDTWTINVRTQVNGRQSAPGSIEVRTTAAP